MTESVSLVLAALVVAVGSFLQGAVGFGSALLAAPLLLLIDPRFVPGPLIVAGILLSLLVIRRDAAGVEGTGVGWTLAGRVPGTIAGAAALASLPMHEVQLLLALLILAAVAISASGVHPPVNRSTLLAAGLLSGVMGTMASIGGPPLALIYQRLSGPTLRTVLSINFAAGGAFSLVALFVAGRFAASDLVGSAALAAGAAAGFALSHRGARWIDAGYTRIAVLGVSGASALAILVRELC